MEVFDGAVSRPWFGMEKPSEKNVKTIFYETINKNSIFFHSHYNLSSNSSRKGPQNSLRSSPYKDFVQES